MNSAETAENDDADLQRSYSKVNLTQTSILSGSPEENDPYEESPTSTTTSQSISKHYLNITGAVSATPLSTSYSNQDLLKKSQINIKRNSYDSPSDFYSETKLHYPKEYYLPSYCQSTTFVDVLHNPSCTTIPQNIPRKFNACIHRNLSILSLPQIKSQLRKFSRRKSITKTSEEINNKRIHEFTLTSPAKSPVVSYAKLQSTTCNYSPIKTDKIITVNEVS